MFAFRYDGLICEEDAAIKLRGEVANKFLPAFHVFEDKDVFEFVQERLFEQFFY